MCSRPFGDVLLYSFAPPSVSSPCFLLPLVASCSSTLLPGYVSMPWLGLPTRPIYYTSPLFVTLPAQVCLSSSFCVLLNMMPDSFPQVRELFWVSSMWGWSSDINTKRQLLPNQSVGCGWPQASPASSFQDPTNRCIGCKEIHWEECYFVAPM